ncbi:hypothetical protein F5B17DRAFT_359480 [Nemania serpens]|nr:hypothetical protein F5B17DRAFT_359480 [Nemania serpens]
MAKCCLLLRTCIFAIFDAQCSCKTRPSQSAVQIAYRAEQVTFVRRTLLYNAALASLLTVRNIYRIEPPFAPAAFLTGREELILTDDDSARAHEYTPSATRHNRPLPPRSKHFVADYRSLYLSGELTPLTVVQAIISLIRRHMFSSDEHSITWLSSQS